MYVYRTCVWWRALGVKIEAPFFIVARDTPFVHHVPVPVPLPYDYQDDNTPRYQGAVLDLPKVSEGASWDETFFVLIPTPMLMPVLMPMLMGLVPCIYCSTVYRRKTAADGADNFTPYSESGLPDIFVV